MSGDPKPQIIKRANRQIQELRLAGGRDFAVSGYVDGPIVDQDMRGKLLAAADSMEEMVEWITRQRPIGEETA